MKFKLLVAAALLVSTAAVAQNNAPEENTGIAPKKNILKVNLTSLPLKNYQLQYEHSLTRKV
ncbi:MAG: hypothetical protein EON98_15155, partial [Chitinophagaceae bacterium]